MICYKCKLDKPVVRRSYCTACRKIYVREHYRNNKAKYFASNKRQIERTRLYIIKAKAKPCTDCGVQYPYYVMQFDHLPLYTKLFDIARGANIGVNKVIAEIAKCDIVCANCHAARTFIRHRSLEDKASRF